jgi:hypothetical protein
MALRSASLFPAVNNLYRAVREELMRYKPKSTAAVHIALGGLPDKMRVEVDPNIRMSAKTLANFGRSRRGPKTW